MEAEATFHVTVGTRQREATRALSVTSGTFYYFTLKELPSLARQMYT